MNKYRRAAILRRLFPAICLVLATALDLPSTLGQHVLNPGTAAWVAAARDSRADMLVVGDSVVWFGGDGWDAGLEAGLHSHIGLAGSGLLSGRSTGQGEAYGYRGSFEFPVSQHPYAWRQSLRPGGSGMLGPTVNPSTVASSYRLDLWADGIDAEGTVQLIGRQAYAPYGVFGSSPTFNIPNTGVPTKVSVDLPTNGLSGPLELVTRNPANIDILYMRAIVPTQRGATVTSWGYGGKSTRDFLTDQYAAMGFAGRLFFLDTLIEGGSGKLNVVIAEGFNDRNETEPSLSGITPGSSPAAFRDNISHLMSAIRSDWNSLGLPAEDLTFTLLGMYDIESDDGTLSLYASELRDLSLAEASTSFVDLALLGPEYAAGATAGYYADGVHLSRTGALFYGDAVVATLVSVPEPSAMHLGAGFLTLLLSKPLTRRIRQQRFATTASPRNH